MTTEVRSELLSRTRARGPQSCVSFERAVTETVGLTRGYTDVSLWYAVNARRGPDLPTSEQGLLLDSRSLEVHVLELEHAYLGFGAAGCGKAT